MTDQTYTFGSDEFMTSLQLEKLRSSQNYPITLNNTDFHVLTVILRELAMYGEFGSSGRSEVAQILGTGTDDIEPVEDWAWSWLSGIAGTLGIEGL